MYVWRVVNFFHFYFIFNLRGERRISNFDGSGLEFFFF